MGLEPVLLAGSWSAPPGDPNHKDSRDPCLRISPTRSRLGFYPGGRGGMPTSTRGSFRVKLSSACTRGRVGAGRAKK